MPSDIECPFCHQGEFDLIGLKAHLAWCEAIDDVPTLAEEQEARNKANSETLSNSEEA